MHLTCRQVRPLFSVWLEGQMFCPLTPICYFSPVYVCSSNASSERCPLAASARFPPGTSAPSPAFSTDRSALCCEICGHRSRQGLCLNLQRYRIPYIYLCFRACTGRDFRGWNILQSFLRSILYVWDFCRFMVFGVLLRSLGTFF